MRSEFVGNIFSVREVEDNIRASKKYKEYIGKRYQHPIQGESFPSEYFTKHYEVYPEMEVSWDMSIMDAVFWLSKRTPCLDVLFKYDYRTNEASINIMDGAEAVKHLARTIPGFSDALARVIANGNGRF